MPTAIGLPHVLLVASLSNVLLVKVCRFSVTYFLMSESTQLNLHCPVYKFPSFMSRSMLSIFLNCVVSTAVCTNSIAFWSFSTSLLIIHVCEKTPMPSFGIYVSNARYFSPIVSSYNVFSISSFKSAPFRCSKKSYREAYSFLSAAIIGITGIFSAFCNPSISTILPCWCAISIIFIIRTTGTCIPA